MRPNATAFIAIIVFLIGVVALMAGAGREGLRAARSIVLVIAGLIVMTLLFAVVVSGAIDT